MELIIVVLIAGLTGYYFARADALAGFRKWISGLRKGREEGDKGEESTT